LIGCGESGQQSDTTQLLGQEKYERTLRQAERQQGQRKVERLKRKIARAKAAKAADASEDAPTSVKSSADLDALGQTLDAQVGGAIGVPGETPLVAGSLQTGSAWSTIKVPIALEVIEEAGGTSGLSSSQLSEITAALTASDNDAAAALFDDLVATNGSVGAASQAVEGTLQEAGDTETTVSTQGRGDFSSYGQTDWSLPAQYRFMSGLLNGCVGTADARSLVLDQMRSVTSDTWGLGSTGLPALWKGGWGPGVDGRYLARQMGAVEVNGQQYVVTLAVIPNSGDFAAAQSDATAVAEWLVEHAPARSASGGC
jgi:hypothetical protein